MTKKYTWLFKPHLTSFAFLAIGVFINTAGSYTTRLLGAPFRLDTVGTILCSFFLGPVGGCIAEILGTILCSPHTPALWLYAIPGMWVAICIALLYQRTKLHDKFQLACAGVIAMMLSSLISIPLNFLLWNGYVNNLWGNALIDMLLQNGNGSFFSCILGQLFIDLPDKLLSVLIAVFLLRIWNTLGNSHKE